VGIKNVTKCFFTCCKFNIIRQFIPHLGGWFSERIISIDSCMFIFGTVKSEQDWSQHPIDIKLCMGSLRYSDAVIPRTLNVLNWI